MKNVLIVALLVGLGVSLWFNWKGIGRPQIIDPNLKTIRLGKDSLKLSFYKTSNLQGPPDDSISYNTVPCELNNQSPCNMYIYGRPPINDTTREFKTWNIFSYIRVDFVTAK